MKVSDLSVGHKVRYHRKWLQSVGAVTGRLPFLRGTVQSIHTWRSGTVIASVQWEGDPPEPAGVLASNLEAYVEGRWRGVGRSALS